MICNITTNQQTQTNWFIDAIGEVKKKPVGHSKEKFTITNIIKLTQTNNNKRKKKNILERIHKASCGITLCSVIRETCT